MNQTSVLHSNTADVIRRAMAAARAGDILRAREIGEQGLREGGDAGPLHAMLGVLKCRSGDLAGGAEHLRTAHSLQPNDLTIAINLAAALVETGDFSGTMKVATRERMLADPSLRLARFRGFAGLSERMFDIAVEAYQHIVERTPEDWEAWNNLGNARASLDDRAGALDALRRAHQLNPLAAPTRLNFARELVLSGQLDEAEAVLLESISLDPKDKPATVELAAVLKRKGAEEEVVDLLAKAVELDPSDPDLQVTYGTEARTIRRNDVAEDAFKRALELVPGHADAHINLATLLDHLNREAEISPLIDQADSAGAGKGAVAYMRALEYRRAGRFREGLELLSEAEAVSDGPRIELLRGQFHDRLGEYDAAFEAFSRMNEIALMDSSMPEERAAKYRETVRGDRDTVTREWAAQWRREEQQDQRAAPLFLVGFPRSGTTLLDTMLMSHPRTAVLEEEPTLRDAGLVLPCVADYPTASDEQISSAREAYFSTATAAAGDLRGKLLIDKNPLGTNILPLAYRLFPGARVVVALRHPCDVVLSCFITNFKLNIGMANFLRLETTAELYDLTFSYLERVREQLPLPIHTVRYEELIEEPEAELRRLLDFAGLEWSESVLDHTATARQRAHIKTASYAQVVEPLYTRSAGRWQKYRKHLEPVLPILEPWVAKHGYTL